MLQDRMLNSREPDIWSGAFAFSDPTSGFHYLHTHPLPRLAKFAPFLTPFPFLANFVT